MKASPKTLLIFYILLALLLLFIWGNSLLPVAQSAKESGVVTRILRPFLALFVGEDKVTDHLVRKLAHFCEFGALGVLLGLIRLMKWGDKPFYLSYVIFTGITVAVIDESIQLFSDGRGAQVKDVLLDSAGALTGLLGISILGWLWKILCKNKEGKS